MGYLLLTLLLIPSSFAFGTLPAPREYRLRLFHTHTLKHLDVVYRRDGVYDAEAVSEAGFISARSQNRRGQAL